ncbi:MAG TPA: hypothetical protein PK771_03415 [Spirochaetota bacterium]|nr:hypothetical protein [Spirochaetota bacterium]
MKKLFLMIFVVIFMMNCGYMETKKESLTRPVFEECETLYFNRFPIDFVPTYYVWNALYSQFVDSADMKEGTLFKIVKKPSIEKNIFTINDLKNKVDYTLIENIDLSSDFIYSIKTGLKEIGVIKQFDRDDIYKYTLISGDKSFFIEGTPRIQKTTGVNPDIIHSFNFVVRDDKNVICNIFKENYIFKNEYEIIIDRKINSLNDSTFVILTVFIDQILRENSLDFK